MAGAGSVAWLFEKKGLIVVDESKAGEDRLMELVLNAGAEDMTKSGQNFEVVTNPSDFEAVKNAVGPKTIAVIMELIQGEGGICVADPEFVRKVRALCDEKKMLLIFNIHFYRKFNISKRFA